MNIELILKAIATGEMKISYSAKQTSIKTVDKKLVWEWDKAVYK